MAEELEITQETTQPEGGIEELKKLHQALASDNVFKEYIPQSFDEFIQLYKAPSEFKKLHSALVSDVVFKDYVPATLDESIEYYGLSPLLKKKEPSTPPVSPISAVSGSEAQSTLKPELQKQAALLGIKPQPTLKEKAFAEGAAPMSELFKLKNKYIEVRNEVRKDMADAERKKAYIEKLKTEREEMKLNPSTYTKAEDDKILSEIKKAENELDLIGKQGAEKVSKIEAQNTPFMVDLARSLKSGSAQLLSGLANSPAFAWDIYATNVNKASRALGGEDIYATSEELSDRYGLTNPTAEAWKQEAEQSRKKAFAKYERGFIEDFEKGNYEDAIKQIALSVGESAPTTIAIMASGGVGASPATITAAGGVVFGAQKMEELEKIPAINGLSYEDKVNIALSTGLLEGIFEAEFGLAKIGRVFGSFVKNKTKQQTAEFAKKTFMEVYAPVIRQYLGSAVEESLAESATTFSQNVIDKYYGVDPDRDLSEGIPESFIIGGAASFGLAAPPTLYQLTTTAQNRAKALDIEKKKQALTNDLTNQNIPDDVKGTIANAVKEVNKEEGKVYEEEKVNFDKLTDEGKVRVVELNTKVAEIDNTLNDPELSNLLSEETKSVLENQKKEAERAIEEIVSSETKTEEVQQLNIPQDEKGNEKRDEQGYDAQDIRQGKNAFDNQVEVGTKEKVVVEGGVTAPTSEISAEQGKATPLQTEEESKGVTEQSKIAKTDILGNKIGSDSYKKNAQNALIGRTRERTLPDGTKLKGTYKIVSSDDILASHNEETFAKTKGFPVNENGKTVNDRDYERDKLAQSEVVRIANSLDERAVSQTPTITKDGIVVDGNNRTMSRKLAAKQGTDKQYLDALKSDADMYGINPSDIDNVKNPILVFETEEDIPYTTKEFARFNKAEKKEKSPIEKAVEFSKTISDRARRIIANIYENAEKPSDITSNKESMKDIKNLLIEEGVFQTNEIPRYINPETGTATKEGVAFLETLLIGSALDESTIRLLNGEGMGTIRNIIIKNVVPITQNASLGENSLQSNIQNGVKLLATAKATDQSVIEVVSQMDMFDVSEYSPEDLAIAIMLDGEGLKNFITTYNSEVGTESLFEGTMTKEKIIDNVLNQKIKNYEQVRKNLQTDATKRKGAVQEVDGNIGKETATKPQEELLSKQEEATPQTGVVEGENPALANVEATAKALGAVIPTFTKTPSVKNVQIVALENANLSATEEAQVIDAINDNAQNDSWDKVLRKGVENLGNGWFRVGKTTQGESIIYSPTTNKSVVLKGAKSDAIAVQDFVKNNFGDTQKTAEAYHKAKADGTNPELVAAVEELLGKPKEVLPKSGSVVGGEIPTLKEIGVEIKKDKTSEGFYQVYKDGKFVGLLGATSFEQARNKGQYFDEALMSDILTRMGIEHSKAERNIQGENEFLKIRIKNSKVVEQLLGKPQQKSQAKPLQTEEESKAKAELEPEIKSNLEKIQEQTGTNFREIQNVYNKYGEGKPLNEITVEDYRRAEAKRQAEKEPTEKQIADTAQKAGITPKNLRDLYKINRELFGLDRIKSLASAIAMDRMVGVMAKRANITKAEMYGRLKFEKDTEANVLKADNALFQGTVDGKPVTLRNMDVDVVNGFYSPLEKIISETKQEKMPAKQWLDKFARGEEAKWTGLQDWLSQQQGSISKQDILNYLKDNRIGVVEVVKSGKTYWDMEDYENFPKEVIDIIEKHEDDNEAIANDLEKLGYLVQMSPDFEIQSFSKEQSPPKFSQYQLEGEKENYKEVLVTLPSKEPKIEPRKASDYSIKVDNESQFTGQRDVIILKNGVESGRRYGTRATDEEIINDHISKLDAEDLKQKKKEGQFKSSHFEEPNILVHLRMNTRTDVDGKKVLFLEEVQSDFGQSYKKDIDNLVDFVNKNEEKVIEAYKKNGKLRVEC